MKKSKWIAIAAVLLCGILLVQCAYTAQNVPELTAGPPARTEPIVQTTAEQVNLSLPCRAALLMDQDTGTVLYDKNGDTQMPMASITKLMTLLLTFEAIHDGKLQYDQEVPVSEHAAAMGGSQIWLEPGEHFTLKEMLKAVCVCSANDAAVAVAELVAGSEPAFVSQMNARAAELGMENTNYCNACGLDASGHYSTAHDVAILSRYILNTCPEILEYSGIWTDQLRSGETHLVNTNKLLKRYPGMTGLKTGTTSGAGVCISATAVRDDLSLIAVILGSPSGKERFEAATSLLDYGFANYEAGVVPALPNAPLELPVRGAKQGTVQLDYNDLPMHILLKKGEGKDLRTELELPESVEAPLDQSEELGTVNLYAGEEKLGSWAVKSAMQVEKLDFASAFDLILRQAVGGESM